MFQTIKVKLQIITGLVLLFCLVGGFLTFRSLSTLYADFERLKNYSSQAKIDTLTINKDMNYISRLTRDTFLGGDYDKNMEKMAKTISAIDATFNNLKKITLDAGESTKEIEESYTATMKFLNISKQIMDSLRNDHSPQALQAAYPNYHKQATPPAEEARETFAKVVKAKEIELEKTTLEFMHAFSSSKITVIAVFALTFIFGVLPLVWIGRYVIFSLYSIKNNINELASSKDLTRKIHFDNKDEIGDIVNDFNHLCDVVEVTIREAKMTSNENASLAEKLSRSSQEIGQRVDNQAESMNQTAENASSMNEMVNRSTQESLQTQSEIASMEKDLLEAKNEILEVMSAIQGASARGVELADKLSQLSNDAEQVKSVLTVIYDIADQTNLLALNAAIEAARAGDHGRGFAVVADEVRSLAEKTQRSLVEINSSIGIIVQAIMTTSEEMNETSDSIKNVANASAKIETILQDLTQSARNAKLTVTHSTEVSLMVKGGIEKIIDNIQSVNSLSRSNSQSVHDIAEASRGLNAMSHTLQDKLNLFTT